MPTGYSFRSSILRYLCPTKSSFFWKLLMTSLHVIWGPPIKNHGYAYVSNQPANAADVLNLKQSEFLELQPAHLWYQFQNDNLCDVIRNLFVGTQQRPGTEPRPSSKKWTCKQAKYELIDPYYLTIWVSCTFWVRFTKLSSYCSMALCFSMVIIWANQSLLLNHFSLWYSLSKVY